MSAVTSAVSVVAGLLVFSAQAVTLPPSLAGQVYVITGASSGIGEAVALQLAQRGATLVLAARRLPKLQSVAQACRDQGATNVTVVEYDAGVAGDADHLIAVTLAAHHRLDVLVLNAGISGSWAPFSNLTNLTSLERVMAINYLAYVRLTMAAIPALTESRGTICAVTSMYGHIAAPFQAGYSASKFALHGFFASLRPELALQNVHVVVHSPGGVATEIVDKFESARGQPVHFAAPSFFLAPVSECAASVIFAIEHKIPMAFYPTYAGAFSFFRAVWPTVFDSWYFTLVQQYVNWGILAVN